MSPVNSRGALAAPISIVGVGPGDPELLTLRAAAVLRGCDVVMHAGRADREGFAYEVVVEHLGPHQRVEGAALAMRRRADLGSIGYERVALRLVEVARSGQRAAFLTEGDPMLYGSGAHVAASLRTIDPDVPFEIVPGVSAVSAVAARLGWPLAQKQAILTVCPAMYHAEEIGTILDRGGSTCWLKAREVLPELVSSLGERGWLSRAALVERVGRPDERIFLNLAEALPRDLSYFSLVLVR
jgi:precorrin-2/cobalt-factor-2 C20-methyltransferase